MIKIKNDSKTDLLPVVVLCVRRERRATEAHWHCRWQHRRDRRSVEYHLEIWKKGQNLSLCRIQTQSCRGSGSGPGSPRPAPVQPATSTARLPSAASGGSADKSSEPKRTNELGIILWLCTCSTAYKEIMNYVIWVII